MTPAHRTPRIDLTGRCLLLADEPAPGVDVVVLDLGDVPAPEVADLVTGAEAGHRAGIGVRAGTPPAVAAALAAGVGLVMLDVTTATPDEVQAVAEAGVVVVLHQAEPAAALAAVDRLHAAGFDTARVVVEVGPGADVVEDVAVLERTAFGFRVGAVVDRATAPHPTPAQLDGWEIGTLAALLDAGVATIRGVAPERFRRVGAVVHEIDAAAGLDGPVGAQRPEAVASSGTVAP